MANEEILTDDYVAGLLTKDAKESSIRYSALGLEGFAQSKPPANKPKPNTRFLRNIIKDTDSHNAALQAKEAVESRARLEDLEGNGHREEKTSHFGGGDIRRRQLGDIAAILGGGPRKHRKVEEKRPERRRRNNSSEEDEPEKSKDHRNKKRRSKEDHNEERSSRIYRSQRHKCERSSSKDRGKDRDRRKRERSRSLSPKNHRDKESWYRYRSPKRRRSRSPDQERRQWHRSHRHRQSPSIDSKIPKKEGNESSKKPGPTPDSDSDPLDDIIGPRVPPNPEVRSRGRGTMSGASGMDSRFAANYNPTADLQLDADEENDWDQALEALRDRQKWKQQGADRLRAAGFTEEEVKKWEKGGEKREEDVKWAKKGEWREWDRGKAINDERVVTHEPSFGRLKGE